MLSHALLHAYGRDTRLVSGSHNAPFANDISALVKSHPAASLKADMLYQSIQQWKDCLYDGQFAFAPAKI